MTGAVSDLRRLAEYTTQLAQSQKGSDHKDLGSARRLQLSSNQRLLMQNHVQQGTVDFNLTVVIDKPQFTKLVHECANAGSRRTDHVREGLLADFRQDGLRLTFLAKIRKQQKGPR
jgi:hypothetical protein